MNSDLTSTADLPEPFNERWAGATLYLYNVDWYGGPDNIEGTALLKAPDARGASALAAHFGRYGGSFDLVQAGKGGSRFEGGSYIFVARRVGEVSR